MVVALLVALLLGLLLAAAFHWRQGQDVQPEAKATIEYEPLAAVSKGQGSAPKEDTGLKRLLDRVRSWKGKRK